VLVIDEELAAERSENLPVTSAAATSAADWDRVLR
jgi:hypothetical protein